MDRIEHLEKAGETQILKCKLTECLSVNENDSVLKISKLLKKEGARQLIVTDKENKPKGIVTLTDIVYKLTSENKDPSKIKAINIATKDIFVLDKHENVGKAYIYCMSRNRLFCPIVEKEKLIGILTLSELIKVMNGK